MKGLTVLQPWAFQIGHGKPYETRTWLTRYRGPLAIHAGSRFNKPEREAVAMLRRAGIYMPVSFVLGAVVAVAELVDCIPLMDTPETLRKCIGLKEDATLPAALSLQFFGGAGVTGRSLGLKGFVLENIRVLSEPYAIRGAQQLWTIPDGARAEILRRVK